MWTSEGEWRQKATHRLKTQKPNEKRTLSMGVHRDREGGPDGGGQPRGGLCTEGAVILGCSNGYRAVIVIDSRRSTRCGTR